MAIVWLSGHKQAKDYEWQYFSHTLRETYIQQGCVTINQNKTLKFCCQQQLKPSYHAISTVCLPLSQQTLNTVSKALHHPFIGLTGIKLTIRATA